MKQTNRVYRDLMLAMLRTGILGFGGGPSVMPLFQHEVVRRYKWLSEDAFDNALAIANVLPGPIATKMAAYIGYERRQLKGAIWSVFWHILPSTAAMIVLLSLATKMSDSVIVQGIIAAVTPVVVMMLFLMGYRFAKKTYDGLGFYLALLACLVAGVLLSILHPAIVIVLFVLYGSQHYKLIKNKKTGER